MIQNLTAAGALALAAATTFGQAGWTVTPIFAPGQTGITPQTPSCTIRVSAYFSRHDYAFAAALWDMLADESGWSQNRLLPPFTVGANPGTISGPGVTRIIGGQVHMNGPAPVPGNPSNPIAVWEGIWTAQHFTPRVVRFSTITTRFDVYTSEFSPLTSNRLTGFSQGTSEVLVSPAPGALSALGLFAAAAARRSRRTSVDAPVIPG